MPTDRPLVALAGNPNVGKTTIFNALTGMRQHTGNWPGKTVEQKTGSYEYKGQVYDVIDLPGTYSLTAVSTEEVIARDYIVESNLDCLVVVMDATCLERNLFLVTQILELTSKVVIALNLMDQAELAGIKIDITCLSMQLGVPVVPLIAVKKTGLESLKLSIKDVVEKFVIPEPVKVTYSIEIETMIRTGGFYHQQHKVSTPMARRKTP